MKPYIAGLVLVLSLGLAFASPVPNEIKEDQAIQECNATNPVQRNPRVVMGAGIATGERIKLSQEEKCFLFCFLQKVKFLDENANIRNASGLVKYTIKSVPELSKYADVVIAQIFQISRSTKGFDEKCLKAYVVYHQYAQGIFTLAIADGLQSFTGIKDKIITAIETGQSVDHEVTAQNERYLTFVDALVSSYAKELQGQS